MSYNSDSGIISAPVSIDDVKRALGESSNDLATLCKSENINIWSKYKPISCKGEFKEYPIREDSDEIVTSSYSKYTCVVRCGMNIPMDTYKNLRNNYGGEGFAIEACKNFYIDNVYGRVGGIHGDTTTSVSGKHFPKGGANSPYRLSDFRNYNSKATSNTFLTSLPQFNTVEVYYSSIRKFNCVLYMNTNVDNNTNLTMDDIITDLSLAWSFWIQIRYDSPYNTDKIYKNYYVGNCQKPTDFVYASKEITFDIGSGDKIIDIVPFLAYTRNATLYDDTKIIFISLPGAISFKYYPRQIYMESIKSGSSDFVYFSELRELVGGSCICKAKIYKLPDGALTVTDGMFRSVCTYGNNKTTYGRGYVSNSSGQNTGSVTIPEGDRTDYIEVYIRFDNVYEGGYYGQRCQLSFEINIDGGWKQVPPGGSYIMR
ncbi:hypothetical protein [Segatella copri]|uniref:Uncharacterized protein n=1 Tax=Segatella copri TaxID=165179 RepID=A0AA90V4C5_9BACT|nr:hypothetical protein [Segatella copri]MQN85220.1 hypothetical protein [Segatella copri]